MLYSFINPCEFSDSFTTLGLWVLGLATSIINESPLQTNESKTLFLMTSLPYYCIPGLAEKKLMRTALALVDVLGVFTSEIGFRTQKTQRSDVL